VIDTRRSIAQAGSKTGGRKPPTDVPRPAQRGEGSGEPATELVQRHARVPLELAGSRLDAAAARLFDEFSRSRLQIWIAQGALQVNGAVIDRPRLQVHPGDELELRAELPREAGEAQPQDIALSVLFSDEHLAIINKPAGLIVHPGAGAPDGTLQNALLHRFPQTAAVPRAGIVHRLDKDTSGILVVALNLQAHAKLVSELARRKIRREYDAIVAGVFSGGGKVEAPIGRHPRDRSKMAVVESGRPALSHYRIAARFRFHTHVRVRLETGRTHQIRVHMAHIKHPVVGDAVYAPKGVRGVGMDPQLRARLAAFPRQALHARELELVHPATQETMQWSAEPPADMQALLAALRADSKAVASS
jgi:23S rRNA pseudouridine1911/1915/1917 synthase